MCFRRGETFSKLGSARQIFREVPQDQAWAGKLYVDQRASISFRQRLRFSLCQKRFHALALWGCAQQIFRVDGLLKGVREAARSPAIPTAAVGTCSLAQTSVCTKVQSEKFQAHQAICWPYAWPAVYFRKACHHAAAQHIPISSGRSGFLGCASSANLARTL